MQKRAGLGEAMARTYPNGIIMAVARGPSGKYNPITLGLFMQTSGDPPMFAISVAPERYSFEVIRSSKQFVLSYPSLEMASDALFHGTHSGRNMDKLAECKTRTQPASKIDCVLLSDAVANLECELVGELESGDHVIFLGRVVASHVNEDPSVKRLYCIGPGYELGGAEPRPIQGCEEAAAAPAGRPHRLDHRDQA